MKYEYISWIINYVILLIFFWVRTVTYLHFYQQEEYTSGRFLSWIAKNLFFDKRLSCCLFIIAFIPQISPTVTYMSLNLLLPLFIWHEKKQQQNSKKKLKWTARSKRIAITAMLLIITLYTQLLINNNGFLIYVFLTTQIVPLALILANLLLVPLECTIQRYYLLRAKYKLRQIRPIIIAITGSYGKTSTKHILSHLLSQDAPTLMTPGSVNTVMGITRVILQALEVQHRYLVIEMGAYYPGSIAKLCKTFKPHHGLIVSVGMAHLERFKTKDNILHAKFELADSIEQAQGHIVIHRDSVPMPYIQHRLESYSKYWLFTDDPSINQYRTVSLVQCLPTDRGLDLSLNVGGKIKECRVSLFGKHHAVNVAASVSLCWALGLSIQKILASLKHIPQIEHRLQVHRMSQDVVIIDDTYNANPEGFKFGLQTLNRLGQGRRILITPGLVELGFEHERIHYELGQYTSEFVDVVLLIQSNRFPSFKQGLLASGFDINQILCVSSFIEAQKWIEHHAQPKDARLYANDLPDLYGPQIVI